MKAHAAIVCDQVRREDNGKEILIGVYSSDILIPLFPATLLLAFWVQVSAQKAGSYDIEFRIKVNGKLAAELSGKTAIKKGSAISSISTPQVPIEFRSIGTLGVEFREKSKRWKTISTLPVSLK